MAAALSNILVPVDGSEGACKAAAFAAALAGPAGASLTLATVLETEGSLIVGASALSSEELEQAMEAAAERAFSDAQAAVAAAGMEAQTLVLRGKPSAEIIRYAGAGAVDLIVMGSRGLTELRELLLGSVSSQVLHHAPCSVTVVR